ncbi:MAG: DUF308 domain-containing protein [Roseburia sp.]|nr:DUF308 domain-containing protein [Roseburia sp.]MCM1098764.1 DUF308 domain-containing protein [Ruminococcus flavefaciens]
MMKTRSVVPMKIAKTGYVVMSIVFCMAGILFMTCPELSVKIIGRALGIAMIVFGCIRLVGYFSKDLFRLAFQYDLEFGILLIALGLIILVKSANVMNFIFIALGIAILADGLFKIQIAIDARRFGIGTWWLILLLAALTGGVGLLLVFRPVESAYVLTMLLGVSLLAEGILNLCVVLSTVKIVRHQRPDIIDGEYQEIRR